MIFSLATEAGMQNGVAYLKKKRVVSEYINWF